MSKLEWAQADARLIPLLTQVKAQCKVHFKRAEGDMWGSSLEDGIARIYHTDTDHPAASLAHELLHIIVQLKGIRQLRVGFWTLDQTERLNRFMKAVNNELQHHKMFSHFTAAGFAPNEFYHDGDSNIESYLGETVSRGFGSLIQLVPDFLTLLAPGGAISQQAQNELLNAFLAVNGGGFCSQLIAIRNIVRAWASTSSFDNVQVVKEICLQMQNPCVAWFGFEKSARPPNTGFFVGKKLKLMNPKTQLP